MELIGLFLVASALLVVAGIAKAVQPGDTAGALAVLASRPFRPRWRTAVRVGAIGEAGIGIAALALPRPTTAALVATSYAVFTGVVVLARRRGGPLATCGCFGRPDTPPTLVHLALNVLFLAAALTVTLTAPAKATLGSALASEPGAGIPLVFVSAVGVWLSVLAMSALGRLQGARRPGGSPRRP
jgi:Methylamine utilisation protein MauE